jgi:hypothetical protein
MKEKTIYCEDVKANVIKSNRCPEYECKTCPKIIISKPLPISRKNKKPVKTHKDVSIKKIGNREKPFSTFRGATYAGWVDPQTGDIPLEVHIKGTKKSPTGDDEKLHFLVWLYERVLKEKGADVANNELWGAIGGWVKEGVLSKEEYSILCDAEVAGSITQGEIEDEIEGRYFKAVQTIVKANPDTIELPFIRNALKYILRKQKYEITDAESYKYRWNNFLHKRPKRKILYSSESIKRLVEIAKRHTKSTGRQGGGKTIDAYEIVAEGFGVSEDYLKKKTAIQRQRERPKKSK